MVGADISAKLDPRVSRNNFYSFLWHGIFLALAQNFMDVDTILPAMLIESGGTSVHVGVMTAIMLGGASTTQLFFAPFISNFNFKKKFLLLGINSRMAAILGLILLLVYSRQLSPDWVLWLIFALITVFSVGGAFANVSYTDIFGKSVLPEQRKSFFSIRQVVIGAGVFISALFARQVLVSAEYPLNYLRMFIIGFIALSMASAGFWKLREGVPSSLKIRNVRHFYTFFKNELKLNPRLKYFLAYVNTQGIVVSLMPFLLLYAKQMHDGGVAQTGLFLIFKVLGTISAGLVVFLLKKRIRYRNILKINPFIAITPPFFLILFPGSGILFPFFLIGGIVYSLYSISMNGVLLEVSGTENRALYTGIAGAGNIVPALFPLLGGWLIKDYGFSLFFIIFILVVLSSLYFIRKMDCQR